MPADALLLEEASRIVAAAIRDKSYEDLPLGQDVKAYLRVIRKRLTPQSQDAWEIVLARMVRAFPGMRVEDFEPPHGTELVEQFMDDAWGQFSGRYQNRNHTILNDFFKFHRMRGRLKGDPMLNIEKARTEQPHRTTFSKNEITAILGSQAALRDKIAVRLMLHYGFRGGTMRKVQFKHFDFSRKTLTTFAKGGKVRSMGLPEPALWDDLQRLALEAFDSPSLPPDAYLMCSARGKLGAHRVELWTKPMSNATFHMWWYRCLEQAGVVEPGTTRGRKPHEARHTAGQHLYDRTKDLKLVQTMLDHASIQTTADIYLGRDEGRLTEALTAIYGGDE